MFLIVGLGNPGREYENTRHNAGFLLAEKCRKRFGFSEWKMIKKFQAEVAEGKNKMSEPLINTDYTDFTEKKNKDVMVSLSNHDAGNGADKSAIIRQAQDDNKQAQPENQIIIIRPQTFMNLSGKAVSAVRTFYKIPIENILVLCDDVALPLGKIRLREKGSAGGHNGLKSIIEQIGSQDFWRLRIGIETRETGSLIDTSDFVLGKFPTAELKILDESLERAVQGVELFLQKRL